MCFKEKFVSKMLGLYVVKKFSFLLVSVYEFLDDDVEYLSIFV